MESSTEYSHNMHTDAEVLILIETMKVDPSRQNAGMNFYLSPCWQHWSDDWQSPEVLPEDIHMTEGKKTYWKSEITSTNKKLMTGTK